MTYNRYSVDATAPSWMPVGERNQFKLIIADCWMGKAGQVVKENWIDSRTANLGGLAARGAMPYAWYSGSRSEPSSA